MLGPAHLQPFPGPLPLHHTEVGLLLGNWGLVLSGKCWYLSTPPAELQDIEDKVSQGFFIAWVPTDELLKQKDQLQQ